MKKRKLFFGVLALGGIFALASCDNEDVNKLKEEISTLKSEKETLTTENTSLKNDKTTLTNENNSLKIDKETLLDENSKLGNLGKELKKNNSFAISFENHLGNIEIRSFNVSKYTNVLDALRSFRTVKYSDGYIKRIDSFLDPNWAVMIYENGEMTSTGIEQLEINSGDVFELIFKFPKICD